MKTITFLITLLTFSVSIGQNLIVNGDFETGDLTGWSGYNNKIAIENQIVYGSYIFPGGYGDSTPFAEPITHAGCMLFNETDLYQEITVNPGSKYIVQFFFRPSFDTFFDSRIRDRTGDLAGIFLSLTPIVPDTGTNNSDSTKYRCKPDAASNPTLDWEEASYSFVAPAGVTKVRFQNFSNNTAALFMDEVSILLDETASLEDLQKFNFSAYPNPAKDHINLSAVKNISKIEIYSLLGQQVKKITLKSNTARVNVSGLAKGVYVVKTFIEDAVGTYKFIKE